MQKSTRLRPKEHAPTVRIPQHVLAERWSVSTKTLERWRIEGIGPVYIRLPGRVVYRLEDIETFERNALRRSTAEYVHAGDAR
jgi:predicted site-specific integrase-resolvase